METSEPLSRVWAARRIRVVLAFARDAFSRRINYAAALLPTAAVAVAIPFLVGEEGFGRLLKKGRQEIAAPVVLALALASCIAAWTKTRHAFFAWYGLIVFGLLNRELHYGFHHIPIAVILLIVSVAVAGGYAFKHLERMEPWITNRAILSAFLGTFGCYFISQGLDNRWFGWPAKDTYWRSHTEECLETVGHLYFLVAVWACGWWRGVAAKE